MREMDLGDLGFSPEEQELLRRMERGVQPRQVSRRHWWRTIAIVYVFALALELGVGYQNQTATEAPRATVPPQTTPSVRQQTDRAAYARYTLGVGHRQRNEYVQGIPELDQAIHLKPDFAEAYEERGYAYLRLKRYERAIHDLRGVHDE